MKTTFTTQRNAASTLHASHSTHTAYSPLRRLTVLVALLMTFALGARAQNYYVFTYTNNNNTYFLGESTTPTTSFVPNASIYSGTSGSTFRNANNYYIRYNYGLNFDKSTGTNLTIDDNYLAYIVENWWGDTYYYLNMQNANNNNRTWRMSETNNYRATAYTVTTSSVINDFTISGDATIKAAGTYSYMHTNATYYDTYQFNNKTYYSTDPSQAASTTIPTNNLPNITDGYTWTISNNSYASVNASTGAITVNSLPTTATEVTLTCSVSRNGVTKTATKTITLQQSGNTPTAITASDFSLGVGTDDDISYTLTGTAPIYDKVEATSNNTGIFTVVTSPTSGGKVTLHPVAMGNATLTLIAKAKDGATNACSTTVKITVAEKVKTPTIEYEPNGAKAWATITCATEGAIIYYTIDGSEPTPSSTIYESRFEVAEKATVKAMAVKSGYLNSNVASRTYEISKPTGVDGGVVTLNDLEDHNWTYYQQSSNLPSGYPTTYLSSPNPRNVKITYRAGGVDGASAVAISALEGEGQNEMVYYKTLEKSVPGMSGDYPYTVISNPFSKRPKKGSTYYGFAGWKIVDGGEYISEHDDGQTLGLDETIHFTNLDNNYTPNCMSAEIVFEATWTEATVKTGSSAPSFDGGSYETNFWVLSGNSNISNISVPANCTVSSRYPDGTVNFNSNLTGTITAGGNNAKVEFVNMNSTGNVSAANKTFTMGRGIVNSGDGGQLQGCTSDSDCEQTVKVESGTYSSLYHFTNTLNASRKCNQLVILGCDYDRAKKDNNKLKITSSMYLAYTNTINRTSGTLFARSNIKSGTFQKTISGTYSGTAAQSYYFGCYGSSNRSAGHRYMLVEGGDIRGLCGGTDHTTNQKAEDPAFTLRVRGTEENPIINGIIYGAAENAACQGRRTLIFTGGTVKGWIAGGANGTSPDQGIMTGASYVYVGGNANIDSDESTTVINRAVGGNVFGAGCGYSNTSNSGQVTQGTNVVIADNAYVERGVYGGGSYGYTTATSNIYITGGRVDGSKGGVTASGNSASYSANIPGGVYGGACQNQGGTVNIYMTGGEVNGGLYGGSNNSGTIANDITMNIHGGQVGTSLSQTANIHGGGYGQNTAVSGNVTLTLGANTTDPGVTVYGDVYGGSALGTVNYANSDETKVTLNCGIINGSLYGGGLGNATYAAAVNGKVTVTANGGRVTGAVYGCNNENGAPANTVTVNIINTASPLAGQQYALNAVYGGGNKAAYNYSAGPVVNVRDGYVGDIFGGGNQASVKKTDVNIYGGQRLGNVYGGGNQADIEGNNGVGTDVDVTGGNIGNVFGGNNASGTITGSVSVYIIGENSKIGSVYGGGNLADYTGCPSVEIYGGYIDNVFGGGNEATVTHTNVDIYGGHLLKNVFGGGNKADVTGNQGTGTDLYISGGRINNAFGGNNLEGTIGGSVIVNITKAQPVAGEGGETTIDYVYGGGNLAAYEAPTNNKDYPVVNMINGTVRNAIYGGGYGKDEEKGVEAIVTGNPQVRMTGGTVGYAETVDDKQVVRGGDIFGGGNAAQVIGNTSVTITNGTVMRNVYGGGNQAKVTGKTNVVIGQGS